MKSLFTFFILFASLNIFNSSSTFCYASTDSGNGESEKVEIDIDKSSSAANKDKERSLDFYQVEALIYKSSNTLEVSLYNIGEATVYILNGYNQVVYSETVNTETPSITSVVLNQSGLYHIVVTSSDVYAEGSFTL